MIITLATLFVSKAKKKGALKNQGLRHRLQFLLPFKYFSELIAFRQFNIIGRGHIVIPFKRGYKI